MSANCTWWVKVLVPSFEWRTVSALTEEDARKQAKIDDPEVMMVLEVSLDRQDYSG